MTIVRDTLRAEPNRSLWEGGRKGGREGGREGRESTFNIAYTK